MYKKILSLLLVFAVLMAPMSAYAHQDSLTKSHSNLKKLLKNLKEIKVKKAKG